MDEEDNSRQEEARKVLESIRQQGAAEEKTSPEREKTFARLPSEDAAELETLISNTILAKSAAPIPEEIPEIVETPEINPISTKQIKFMRKVAAEKADTKEPILKVIYKFIIKSCFDTIAYFQPVSQARRCQEKGHLCAYCGVTISPSGIVQENKGKANPPAPK